MKSEITLVTDGVEVKLNAEEDERISDVFLRYGIHIDMPCAGKGICNNCTININGKMCLACQKRAENGMKVKLLFPKNMENIAVADTADIFPKKPLYSQYGVCVDIGTTTICASLMDTEVVVNSISRKNPQTVFGADVISRMEKSISGRTDELAKCVQNSIMDMITELCVQRNIEPEMVDAAVITGNTAMLYLLIGKNPISMTRAPFLADRLFGEYVKASLVGLKLLPNALVYLPRCVSAFVGADMITAIVACKMCEKEETSLIVDIGTNGEIALWHDGRIFCCSTAAGPAFEGAGITCGVYGTIGAIDKVWVENNQLCYSTIGGRTALGICGSGIIDSIAVMLKLGVLDESGAFSDVSKQFELKKDIVITARDVRKIQLAKSAIRAGIESLLEICEIKKQDIESFYISGGFGNFINIENAALIGLIPAELSGCTKAIGNAAHTGALMLLNNKTLIAESERLAGMTKLSALDANPIFSNNYIKYMTFSD